MHHLVMGALNVASKTFDAKVHEIIVSNPSALHTLNSGFRRNNGVISGFFLKVVPLGSDSNGIGIHSTSQKGEPQ